MVNSYERGDSVRLTHIFYSGSVASYPLSANLSIIKPDGTYLYKDVSGLRTGTTGEFYYHISTATNADLGIYQSKWSGKMKYGNKWGNLPDVDMDQFIITTIA